MPLIDSDKPFADARKPSSDQETTEIKTVRAGAADALPNFPALSKSQGGNALDDLEQVDNRIREIDDALEQMSLERQARCDEAAKIRDKIQRTLEGSLDVADGKYHKEAKPVGL